MKFAKILPTILFSALIVGISSCHRKTIPAKSPSTSNADNNNVAGDTANMKQDILFYINQHRKSIGLTTLQMLNIASIEATRHCTNMANHRVAFGHDGFEARVAAIARSLGTVSAAAENVADGQLTAKQVVDGWLHSPGHKKNIEGNYALTGIGIARDAGGVLYFTEIFILK